MSLLDQKEQEDKLILESAILEQEYVLFLSSLPSYTLCLLGTITLISLIAIKASLRSKPRHVFQAFSLLNSLVGLFFGVYGVIFLADRLALVGRDLESEFFYLFVFHRYLLLLGDMLPSLDRCLAVCYPLMYFKHATARGALGKMKWKTMDRAHILRT